MSSPTLLTDRRQLEELFDELATELHRLGAAAEIVMVGGAWMLWHAQRAGTQDVDSARRLTNDLNEAIQRVGDRHDLAPHWLNDNAAAYWPTGASFDDCETVYQRDTLVVRTPPADVIFVMKLYRADPQDREDMINLWPVCTFTSPEQAAEVFHASYPHAPHDEHLADYIGAIAQDID